MQSCDFQRLLLFFFSPTELINSVLPQTRGCTALSVSLWKLSGFEPQPGNSGGPCVISGAPQACVRLWALANKKRGPRGNSEEVKTLRKLWLPRNQLDNQKE